MRLYPAGLYISFPAFLWRRRGRWYSAMKWAATAHRSCVSVEKSSGVDFLNLISTRVKGLCNAWYLPWESWMCWFQTPPSEIWREVWDKRQLLRDEPAMSKRNRVNYCVTQSGHWELYLRSGACVIESAKDQDANQTGSLSDKSISIRALGTWIR